MGLERRKPETRKRVQAGDRNMYVTDFNDFTLNDLENQLQELNREVT